MLYVPYRNETVTAPFRRERILVVLCAAAGAVLLALLAARGILREPPGVSSFGALADAFLHGRLYVESCPETDCAVFQGRTYVIFPPLPAVILMPFIALTGLGAFKGAIALAAIASILSVLMWKRIFAALDVDRAATMWLLTALAFSSPLFYVTMKGNGAWFFAQAMGFLMATMAIASVILWRSLFIACIFVALGFLCRQMMIFYPLFLLVLAMRSDEGLLRPSLTMFARATAAALPVLAALGLIFAYNYARFGNPLDTGYGYISNPGSQDYITTRIAETGLFSVKYLAFNLYYFFLQGFHAHFDNALNLKLTGIDWNGTALLIACPWVALAFYMKFDRIAAAGLLTIAVIAGITFFYHSNGYAQIGASRYILDWLPIALVLLARSARPASFRALPLLVTIAVLMNAAAIFTSIIAAAR